MKNVYFISDIHLGAQSRELEAARIERLVSFLSKVRQDGRALYIVGDLFDYWFEYRKVIPRTSLKVLCRLHDLVQGGIEVTYLVGNHDLWIGNYLADELGLTMHRGALDVTLNNLRFYIAHGDGLIRQDRRMRFLNRLFSNRLNIFLYGLLHPDFGLTLMRRVAERSRQRDENPYVRHYQEFALKKIAQGFDGVVLGHTHIPAFDELDANKYYINLGDWLNRFTFLQLSANVPTLRTWPDNVVCNPDEQKLPEKKEV